MCPHLRAVVTCYRLLGQAPEKGRYVICRADHQMIIHGTGIWIWSDDPGDLEECYARH